MASATIDLQLRGGSEGQGVLYYEPGATMHATVQVQADGDIVCRNICVSVGWHTEGRGDRDEKIASQTDLFQGVLQAGSPLVREVALELPLGPWSYAGHYINIVWEVTVNIDVPMGKDTSRSLPFVMAPQVAQ